MKKELGHIISKKVANTTSPTPPPMNWERLDSVTTKTNPTSKNLSTITKIVLISASTVIAVSALIYCNLTKNKPTTNPQVEQTTQQTLLTPKPIKPNIKHIPVVELDSITTGKNQKSRKNIIKKNYPLTTEKLKKKDNFEANIGERTSLETPDAKRESTTTTIYEVDTIFTETYIYE